MKGEGCTVYQGHPGKFTPLSQSGKVMKDFWKRFVVEPSFQVISDSFHTKNLETSSTILGSMKPQKISNLCYSKWGSQPTAWEAYWKCRVLGPAPDVYNQNLHLNKICRWLVAY